MLHRVIKDMYDGAKIRVRRVGDDSKQTLLNHESLHQESVLCPFLFALAMDDQIKRRTHGACYL